MTVTKIGSLAVSALLLLVACNSETQRQGDDQRHDASAETDARGDAGTANADGASGSSDATPIDSGLAAIWAVNDGEKVKRDDRANPNRQGNSAWDGQRITISGAKNEMLAFQLIIEAGSDGATQVEVQLPSLVHTRTGKKLVALPPNADPSDTRNGQIELFTQHYLNVATASSAAWFGSPKAFPKQPHTGWVPDALIPVAAKKSFGGAPFDIAASTNQGVWVDIYVPRDTDPGEYSGSVTVLEKDVPVRTIPVSLVVFDFALPDQNHFNSIIAFAPLRFRQAFRTPYNKVIERAHRTAHRHRVELVWDNNKAPMYGPDSAQPLLDRVTGAAFRPDRGYVGPGEGVGLNIIPASFYYARGDWVGTETQAHKVADAFMTWLKATRPKATTFLYITDEPKPAAYADDV